MADLKQRPGVPMRKKSARAGGEHCGHPPALAGQDAVPHRIDATVKLMEPPVTNATADRARLESEFRQLPMRNHAELTLRKAGDQQIHLAWGEFRSLGALNSPHASGIRVIATHGALRHRKV